VTLLRSAIDHGMIFDDRLHFDRDLAALGGYGPFEELLRPAD